MNEKWEATKWVFWGIAILILLTVIGWAMRPISMRVDREVMVQSHQYKEGMAERVAVLQATITEIDIRLSMGLDEKARKGLEAQRSIINAQLIAARR